ncbi:MAG: hypothetical protein AAGF28_00835 [Pseudomonadota bacterium]
MKRALRAKMPGLAIVFCVGFFQHADAEEKLDITSLMTSLFQVQDRIASGDQAAFSLQDHLRKLAIAWVSEAEPVAKWTDDQFRSLIVLAITGASSQAINRVLAQPQADQTRVNLALAALRYRQGRPVQAMKAFQSINGAQTDERLRPYIDFAQASLWARVDQAKAISSYNTVRLNAPGTLLEEVALRRLMTLHLSAENGLPFFSVAKQYARRFSASPYRAQYLALLRKGVSVLRHGLELETVDEITSHLPDGLGVTLYRDIARDAVVKARLKLAAHATARLSALSQANQLFAVNQDTLKLWSLIASMSEKTPGETSVALVSIERSKLETEDQSLFDATRSMLASITAPLADLGRTDPQKSDLQQPSAQAKSKDGQSLPDTADEELSAMIEEGKALLGTIDDMLAN